jgi:hypothetical protein
VVEIKLLIGSPITTELFSNYYLCPNHGHTSLISTIDDTDWETHALSMWEQIRPFWQTTRDLMLAGF